MSTIKISNPRFYKKDGKVMISFTTEGSKESLEAYYADQCQDAGRVCQKDENGNPVFHLSPETAPNYGVSNTLTRAVTQDGKGIWISENNDLIKYEESLLNDSTISAEKKAQITARRDSRSEAFDMQVAKNTTAHKSAWIAKQPKTAVNDPFTKVK